MQLNDYITLGRSGLRVSRLTLGTMTFANDRWGSDDGESRRIFDRYVDGGGNVLDCADVYSGGKSEELLGRFVAESGLRDKLVIATKFTFNPQEGNPNSGGNGRKNIYRALESSLRRLKMDYIDLYWMHVWDTVTPVEEVVGTLSTLVREGRIRYYGLSDVPAWYAARAQTLTQCMGREPVIALQMEYSLVERAIEREHIPAASELGMGICPWSPLASGFLAGKYTREKGPDSSRGSRLEVLKNANNPAFKKFTERNWRILDALLEVAKELGRPAAQVALNWVVTQPGVTSTIIGATRMAQLEDNLAALSFEIPAELRAKLDDVSQLEPAHPYMFFEGVLQERIHGGVTVVKKWR
ncbi:MAG TPA: aldo/keto reductase [Candidatus Eisenbacteria bacterium]|nr:aldo/keto reductase [Candidatus Eisenbacteria bacterium]